MGAETSPTPCDNCPARLKDAYFYELPQVFLLAGQVRVELSEDGGLGVAYSPKTRHPSDSPAKFSLSSEEVNNSYPELRKSIEYCMGPKNRFIKTKGVLGQLGAGQTVKVCGAISEQLNPLSIKEVKKYFTKDLSY